MDALEKQLAEVSEQRGAEWHSHRIGRFTASEMHRLMTEPRSKSEVLSSGAKTYVLEKASELITGLPCKMIDSAATSWGIEHEDSARHMFIKKTGLIVDAVGFCPYGDYAGGSPDGMIQGVSAGIEIKCPFNSANHVDHLLIECQESLKADFKEYYWQIQSNIFFTNSDHWYFISFDPRFQESEKIFIFKVNRDENDIKRIKEKINLASDYLKEVIIKLKTKKL